jgi:hypothetical protein
MPEQTLRGTDNAANIPGMRPMTVFYIVAGIVIIAAVLTRIFFARDVLEFLRSIR